MRPVATRLLTFLAKHDRRWWTLHELRVATRQEVTEGRRDSSNMLVNAAHELREAGAVEARGGSVDCGGRAQPYSRQTFQIRIKEPT